MSWVSLFKELMTPSDYRENAYGELVNQIGHTFLGVALAVLGCGIYGAIFGEMPVRLYVFAVLTVSYLCVELAQTWLKGDSGFDWLMVTLGAAFPMVALREMSVPEAWYLVDLQANFAWLFAFVAVWAVLLAFRIKARL